MVSRSASNSGSRGSSDLGFVLAELRRCVDHNPSRGRNEFWRVLRKVLSERRSKWNAA